ncbi:MAG TPA: hypothetical protein VGZ22_15700 [Isosphaeraceae bacterium]|nr:hypothetical protein [Isosphaeraceae bacterium]
MEISVEAAVLCGRFASIDDALAKAWRSFQQRPLEARPANGQKAPDPVLGSMRDDAAELDAVVADARKRRSEL